jgi:putative acetyltransferase
MSINDLVIRRESPDQPAVQGLLAELDAYLQSLYPPEANHLLDLAALLAPEVRFFVARLGSQVVGTGAFRTCPGEPATQGQAFGEVKRMMVAPSRRGERIGARLLACIEGGMREQGLALALLETGRDQAEALRLYAAAGYLPHAPFCGYADNGLSVFLGKRL